MPDSSVRVGFVTYSGAPTLTEDDRLAVAPLERLGYAVEPVVWSEDSWHGAEFAVLILRSTWDYHKRPAAFKDWLRGREADGCVLWNPPPLVRWNMDKTYLRDLHDAGVPVSPSVWLFGDEPANLADLLRRNGWARAVIKPTMSATAYQTWTTTVETAADDQLALDQMRDLGGILVQRFEESIANGEWSLLFFSGGFSHSVLKRPQPGDFRVQKEYGGTSEPAPAPRRVLTVAEQVLAQVRWSWLYARVDLVDAVDGVRLMELEMLEPDLFLRHAPEAAERFARAIVEKVQQGGAG